MRVGCIGVGFMGKGIARNLVVAKGTTRGLPNQLYLYDSDPQKIADFLKLLPSSVVNQQVHICQSPAEVAIEADFVSLSLPSSRAAEDVLFGEDSISRGVHWRQSRKTLTRLCAMDHGTFSREFVLQCHERSKSADFYYLDAPVSGGPQGALNGTLSVMVGGETDVIESCRSVLDLFASNVIHFGSIGSGMAAKLVNQALVGMHAQAAAEAITLAKSFGLTDPKQTPKLADMLKSSWGHSKVLELALDDVMRSQREGSDDCLHRSAAPLRNLLKDFKCIDDELVREPSPLLSLASSEDQRMWLQRRQDILRQQITSSTTSTTASSSYNIATSSALTADDFTNNTNDSGKEGTTTTGAAASSSSLSSSSSSSSSSSAKEEDGDEEGASTAAAGDMLPPLHLPMVKIASQSIKEACRPHRGLQDSAFVTLMQLLDDAKASKK